jgi:hypothetical protein
MTALTATSERLAAASDEDGRSTKRDRLLEELTTGVAELTTSERWERFLDVQARFHRYSFLNTLGILLQRPEATRVAGFHTWRQLGRRVRKGEKGIAILAPIVRRVRVEDEDGSKHVLVGAPTAFRIVYVFDPLSKDSHLSDRVTPGGNGPEPGTPSGLLGGPSSREIQSSTRSGIGLSSPSPSHRRPY